MKQGQILNKIIILILFVAIVIYIGASAIRSLSDPIATTISYTSTLEDTVEATGYLVREEMVLPPQSLIVDLIPSEGEKVAKGQRLAYLYQDTAALERRSQMRALVHQVEQLKYTLSKAGDKRDNAKLNREILTGMIGLKTSVERRELNDLPEDVLDLKSLIYKREYAHGDVDLAATQQTILDLKRQIAALQSMSSTDTQVLYADVSGVFSGVVDGYESILTPAGLEELTPADLEHLDNRDVQESTGVPGKLITDSQWYFACNVDEEAAKRLLPGDEVTVRFYRDWTGQVSMRVERVSQPENGQVLVVLSSTRYLSNTTLLRHQRVELIFGSVTGIRVPREAVRVESRTVTDPDTGAVVETYQQAVVYAVVGAQAEAKPVTILAEGEDFFLVEAAPLKNPENISQAKKSLRPGDEIIIRADGLYDGKVLRPG